MKVFKYFYLVLLFLSAIFLITSCKKVLDINNSPNNPAVGLGSPKLVLPAAIVGTVARTGGDLAILGAIWGQYATQSAFSSQYRQLDSYNVDGSQLNGPYIGMSTSGLKNFQFIINKSREDKDWNFYLIATVLKAYTTGVLIDLYDKIPYTEGLQGSDNLNPKFDDGEAIYMDLLKGIDSALGKDFSASTNTSPGKVDLIFPGVGSSAAEAEIDWIDNGNLDKWIAFANTLKLKFYLRMVNKSPTEAESGIKKLYMQNATFLDNNAEVSGFISEEGKDNPMYEQNIRKLNTPDNIRASMTLTSFLISGDDPRIKYYYGTATPVAINQGDYSNNDQSLGSAAKLAQRATDPVVIISAAESYFMQAEARERYFSGSGAKSMYDKAVTESFMTMSEDASDYISPSGLYEYPESGTLEQKIESISVQKWLSFGYGVHYIEGFFEKNRTGYPKTSQVYSTSSEYVPGQFVISKNSVLPPNQLPRRLVYPDVEKNRNTNTPAIVPITTKVWWAL